MRRERKKAFTIIEVSLVLAIAGLIFSMAFIALPALLRTQKNSRRRDDMARLIMAVEDYGMNTNGKTPFREADEYSNTTEKWKVLGDFITRYIDEKCVGGSNGNDPSNNINGRDYDVKFTSCGKDFKDPDGRPYRIKYVSKKDFDDAGISLATGVDATRLFNFNGKTYDGNMDYVFYGFSSASCGSDEGTVDIGYDDRDIAIFYILEGGEIACVDNN